MYVDWAYMQQKRDLVFNRVIAKAQKLGIFDMLGMYQDWNTELVAQFCSTTWRSGNGYDQSINLCVKELPTIFGLANNDFHRQEIIIERTIADNELVPVYTPGNERNYGTTHGLIPEYNIFNNIFRNTPTPKRGDRTNIRGTTRNLLLAILDDQPLPCISIFFWTKMMYMLNHGSQYVIYAPYIQRIINFKTGMDFGYDGKHVPY
jgi:hypothetical protein